MGDVDCEAKIVSITDKGIAKVSEFQLDKNYKNNMKYIVEKGRVTIDGASLTVIDVDDNAGIFSVSLIPHTIENITVGIKKTGDFVNIETDLFGKYVEKILKFDNFENTENTTFEDVENCPGYQIFKIINFKTKKERYFLQFQSEAQEYRILELKYKYPMFL